LTTQYFVPEVVSIADACLGGLQGRSALLIGPEEQRSPYILLLQQAGMKRIYQEDTAQRISSLLPQVQLLMHIPISSEPYAHTHSHALITAASIAQGCIGRRTPLLIFDLADSTSVEELAGLLPAVCLYTPDDIRRILSRAEVQIS
jgi:glutamyl-tRNA reductase